MIASMIFQCMGFWWVIIRTILPLTGIVLFQLFCMLYFTQTALSVSRSPSEVYLIVAAAHIRPYLEEAVN